MSSVALAWWRDYAALQNYADIMSQYEYKQGLRRRCKVGVDQWRDAAARVYLQQQLKLVSEAYYGHRIRSTAFRKWSCSAANYRERIEARRDKLSHIRQHAEEVF